MQSQYAFVYTPEQMSVWRTWWRDVLLRGQRWFAMRLPGNGGMATRVVRYLSVRQKQLGMGLYRVSATFEQRGASVEPVGGDPLWGSVVLLIQGGEAIDQSSYGRALSLADCTVNDPTWLCNGNPTIAINSDGNYPNPPAHIEFGVAPELTLGTQDFCFEGWFRFESASWLAAFYADGYGGTGGGMTLRVCNAAVPDIVCAAVFANGGGFAIKTMAPATKAAPCDVYVCVERVGDNLFISQDGVLASSDPPALTPGYSFNPPSVNPRIGKPGGTGSTFLMRVGQVRLTVGASRYGGAAFTPPTAPYQVGA